MQNITEIAAPHSVSRKDLSGGCGQVSFERNVRRGEGEFICRRDMVHQCHVVDSKTISELISCIGSSQVSITARRILLVCINAYLLKL